MSVDTVTRFFALLAVVSQIGLATAAVACLSAPARRALRSNVRPLLAWFAVCVACVCTAGSLYLSEVAHFQPCRLCWVQRGFMYPLVLVASAAAVAQARWLRGLVMLMSVAGGLVSTYHVAIEQGWVSESTSCDPKNPCSLIWVRQLGYVTIPVMALTGFALIAASMLGQGWAQRPPTRQSRTLEPEPST